MPDAETKAYGQTLLDAFKGMFRIIHDRDNLSAEAFEHAMEQVRQMIMKAAIDIVPSSLDDKGKEQKNECFQQTLLFTLLFLPDKWLASISRHHLTLGAHLRAAPPAGGQDFVGSLEMALAGFEQDIRAASFD